MMITNNPQKLHASAEYFRSIAQNESDPYIKTVLAQLAEEFDQEAKRLEGWLLAKPVFDASATPTVQPDEGLDANEVQEE